MSGLSAIRSIGAFRHNLITNLNLGLEDRRCIKAALELLSATMPSPIGKEIFRTGCKIISSKGAHFHGGRKDIWLEHAEKREHVLVKGSGLYVGPVKLAVEYAKFHAEGALVLVTPVCTDPIRDDDTGTNLYFPPDVPIAIKAVHEINNEYIARELEIYDHFMKIRPLTEIVTDAFQKAIKAARAQ